MNFIIIEDHAVTALGMEFLLKGHFTVNRVDKAVDGASAINLLETHQYDLCLLDITLPNTDTHQLLHTLLAKQPSCKVLVVSNSPDSLYALPYLKLGASGYLNKSDSPENFKQAVTLVLIGNVFLPEKVWRNSFNTKDKKTELSNPIQKLSPRELELLGQILQGKSGRELSEILNIEQSTVATLKGRLMRKLGASSFMDLARLGIDYGLV